MTFEVKWMFKRVMICVKHLSKLTCLKPFLPSFITLIGLSDGILQNWLCVFYWNWGQVDTYLRVICGILAILEDCIAPTSL